MMRQFQRYVALVTGMSGAVCALVFSLNLFFMYRVNEFWSIEDVIRANLDTSSAGVLYNGLTHSSDYREGMAAVIRPRIMAIGSSRAFSVRDYFFNDTYMGLGGYFRGSHDFKYSQFESARQLIAAIDPNLKVLFVFVDYWWFMADVSEDAAGQVTARKHPRNGGYHGNDTSFIDRYFIYQFFRSAVYPLTMLESRALTMDRFYDVLSGRVSTRIGGVEKVGYDAVLNDSGFARDGSYYYLRLRGRKGDSCRHAGDFAAKQKLPHGAYRPGQRIDPRKVDAFKRFVKNIRRAGVHVVPIIPPLAPSMIERMSGDPSYKFIDDWRDLMRREIPGIWDFHDPRGIGSEECEFMDDVHGGDVTLMRIFDAIAHGDARLRPLINAERIENLIARYHGSPFVADYGLWREIGAGEGRLKAQTTN